MRYNEEEIKRHVKERQRSFLTKTVSLLALIIISVIIIAIFPEVTVTFVCVTIIIIAAVCLIKTVNRYSPLIIFSKEITGKNIHEHEYAINIKGPTYRKRWFVPRLKTSEFTGGTNRIKTTVGATVYLRLPDGNVTSIDRLYNGQTDIYEIGDTLYKYPGTRFPIVLDKELEAMPCPLCGTANKHTESKCITCGLKIDK